MPRKRVILAGIVGRYPVGGVTWCALQYVAAFQRLGFEVFYLEDTGECNFDPVENAIATDPHYALDYINRHLGIVGLEEAWAYVDYRGDYHGKSREQVATVCREASLMVNLSGGCWFSRPEYDAIPKVFVDTDPGFTQQAIVDAGEGWYRDFFASHDALFTFALNVGRDSCLLPETGFEWHPTIQPVELDFWPVRPPPPDAPFTTILSWTTDSFPGMGKGKEQEMLQLISLPERTRERILLAVAGKPPRELLAKHGWELVDAVEATIDTESYRAFIQSSRAELGFAKSMYVETRSGWFSDRTQSYLASGRPALVRETGFGDFLPTGEGLLAFEDADDILGGLEGINGAYESQGARAREIAEEHFEGRKVVGRLLETAGMA